MKYDNKSLSMLDYKEGYVPLKSLNKYRKIRLSSTTNGCWIVL